jgi:hypothetical protein
LMGVKATSEMGITKVQVETNSMLLKLALDSNTFELAATGGIVFDLELYLRSRTSLICTLLHVRFLLS